MEQRLSHTCDRESGGRAWGQSNPYHLQYLASLSFPGTEEAGFEGPRRVWERESHFLRSTQAISALGNQCEELLLRGVTLQKVQLLALEVRLVEGKAG